MSFPVAEGVRLPTVQRSRKNSRNYAAGGGFRPGHTPQSARSVRLFPHNSAPTPDTKTKIKIGALATPKDVKGLPTPRFVHSAGIWADDFEDGAGCAYQLDVLDVIDSDLREGYLASVLKGYRNDGRRGGVMKPKKWLPHKLEDVLKQKPAQGRHTRGTARAYQTADEAWSALLCAEDLKNRAKDEGNQVEHTITVAPPGEIPEDVSEIGFSDLTEIENLAPAAPADQLPILPPTSLPVVQRRGSDRSTPLQTVLENNLVENNESPVTTRSRSNEGAPFYPEPGTPLHEKMTQMEEDILIQSQEEGTPHEEDLPILSDQQVTRRLFITPREEKRIGDKSLRGQDHRTFGGFDDATSTPEGSDPHTTPSSPLPRPEMIDATLPFATQALKDGVSAEDVSTQLRSRGLRSNEIEEVLEIARWETGTPGSPTPRSPVSPHMDNPTPRSPMTCSPTPRSFHSASTGSPYKVILEELTRLSNTADNHTPHSVPTPNKPQLHSRNDTGESMLVFEATDGRFSAVSSDKKSSRASSIGEMTPEDSSEDPHSDHEMLQFKRRVRSMQLPRIYDMLRDLKAELSSSANAHDYRLLSTLHLKLGFLYSVLAVSDDTPHDNAPTPAQDRQELPSDASQRQRAEALQERKSGSSCWKCREGTTPEYNAVGSDDTNASSAEGGEPPEDSGLLTGTPGSADTKREYKPKFRLFGCFRSASYQTQGKAPVAVVTSNE